MTLHFGYGSNLWFEQMDVRCPKNKKQGKGILWNWKWIIAERSPRLPAANIIKSDGDFVEGYVFELTKTDEEKLDEKEGVRSGVYVKKYLDIVMNNKVVRNVMTYVDENNTNNAIDKQLSDVNNKQIRCTVGCECTYASRINKGIKDSGLSVNYVEKYIRPFINK